MRGHGIDANVLFETWLNADRSAENWQRFRDRVDNGTNQSSWHSSQARFLDSFKKYPVESALYGVSGGREVVALDADDGIFLSDCSRRLLVQRGEQLSCQDWGKTEPIWTMQVPVAKNEFKGQTRLIRQDCV